MKTFLTDALLAIDNQLFDLVEGKVEDGIRSKRRGYPIRLDGRQRQERSGRVLENRSPPAGDGETFGSNQGQPGEAPEEIFGSSATWFGTCLRIREGQSGTPRVMIPRRAAEH